MEAFMKVKDVMVKEVSVCWPEQNLAEVAAIMWNGRCGALPVLDRAGLVASMITDRDVCIALGTRNELASNVKVKDVALPRVFTCQEDDDATEALNTMVSQNVRRLPVVGAGDKLVGILSIDDILWGSEEGAGTAGIPYRVIVGALKNILEGRRRGHVDEAAELIATQA
jgi:CBS domain-containing protein